MPTSIDKACAIQQQHLLHILLPSESQSSHITSTYNPVQHATLAVSNALEKADAYLEYGMEEEEVIAEEEDGGDVSDDDNVLEFSAL